MRGPDCVGRRTVKWGASSRWTPPQPPSSKGTSSPAASDFRWRVGRLFRNTLRKSSFLFTGSRHSDYSTAELEDDSFFLDVSRKLMQKPTP